MTGKPATAPCGHIGFHIIGQYVQCPLCDVVDDEDDWDDLLDGSIVDEIDPETTKPLCAHCGSDQLQPYVGMGINGKTVYHCHSCGRASLS